MFGDILDKNKAFLDYKTAELKKSKNWHFSKGVCVCLSCPTLPKKRQTIGQFLSKTMHCLLWENHNFSIFFFKFLDFMIQKGVFFYLEYNETHFPGLFCLKSKNELDDMKFSCQLIITLTNYLSMTRTVLLSCPDKEEIRTVDSQSDLRIFLQL